MRQVGSLNVASFGVYVFLRGTKGSSGNIHLHAGQGGKMISLVVLKGAVGSASEVSAVPTATSPAERYGQLLGAASSGTLSNYN